LDPIRTVSARRPRRRRRFSVARPAFVLMRERNPCLLRRLRFRGLYVGFILPVPRPERAVRAPRSIGHSPVRYPRAARPVNRNQSSTIPGLTSWLAVP